MKKSFIFILLAIIAMNCVKRELKYARMVNPFIGTGGHGHTFPGATSPFGMVQLSPDSRVAGWDACSGYHYSDSTLLGFSHTHLSGTGAADYGDILFTPLTNVNNNEPIGFKHEHEKAWAGFYEVELDNDVNVQLTTTTRVGIHQYLFHDADTAYIKINLVHGIGPDHLLDSKMTMASNTEIVGYRRSMGWAKDQMVYFAARFSQPFISRSTTINDSLAVLSFVNSSNPLMVKVGLSEVSIENARENINKEAPTWQFTHYLDSAERDWEGALGKIKADFLSDDDQTIFYTALYHSMLAPNVSSDVNGQYRGMDRRAHADIKVHHTVFSLWDTFRSTHPLFTILKQETNVNMINSMLAMYKESGLLPVWELAGNETGTMIGYHAIPVITDAMVKNLPGFDYELALKAMIASAEQEHLGLKYYKTMGFIPSEKEHESVSKTLEYAYDDWCIAVAAKILDYPEIYNRFIQRAQYFKNMYNPQSGFMQAKRNSNWIQDFDPYEVSGNYTEANAWQYNLFIPQAISQLDDLYMGRSTLENKLDSLFSAQSAISGRTQPDIAGMIGQYAHGNEPSHNFAYLYNYANKPYKTQEIVHDITTNLYKNSPDGLSGNEDCGQMSSWYVFSALGFYPVVPGRPEYAIGSPKVKHAKVKMESGAYFTIDTKNLSVENYYIQSASLNGRPMQRSFITHEEIVRGGRLELEMGPEPAEKWQGQEIVNPISKIEGPAICITPVIDGGEMTFSDSTIVSLIGIEPNTIIRYTLDGTIPNDSSTQYSRAITIDTTTQVKAFAFKAGQLPSKVAEASFIKIPYGRKIVLKNSYSHFYTGNSQMALIDHIYGAANFRDGWQGFEGVDLEANVDLGEKRTVTEVNVGFLQDQYSWIFYPIDLTIEFSTDGKRYTNKTLIENSVDTQTDGVITQQLGSEFANIKARFVRIKARNLKTCPQWHKGAGNPSWLFADEITINTK